jgi:outer membrane protein assembly factor BamD (BamD/ComL family)
MKHLRILFLTLLVGSMAVQCGNDPKARINSLENKMKSDNFTLDEKGMQTAGELIQAYQEYAEKHKNSPDAPEYLYKAADMSLNTNNGKLALDLYNRIIYQYPDFRKVPECLFLMGYIYENYLQELGKAKEIYETFLQKYPDHDFADDARISIQNLGKSPEELIREFEAKNQAQKGTI